MRNRDGRGSSDKINGINRHQVNRNDGVSLNCVSNESASGSR